MIIAVVAGFALAPLLFPKAGTEVMDEPMEQTVGVDLVEN